MTRLIDADALEKDLERRWDTTDCADFADKEVWRALRDAPTIDAVSVVRCKDCKCWTEWANGTGSCSRYALDWVGMDADDFCSMGERKDNDGQR